MTKKYKLKIEVCIEQLLQRILKEQIKIITRFCMPKRIKLKRERLCRDWCRGQKSSQKRQGNQWYSNFMSDMNVRSQSLLVVTSKEYLFIKEAQTLNSFFFSVLDIGLRYVTQAGLKSAIHRLHVSHPWDYRTVPPGRPKGVSYLQVLELLEVMKSPTLVLAIPGFLQ